MQGRTMKSFGGGCENCAVSASADEPSRSSMEIERGMQVTPRAGICRNQICVLIPFDTQMQAFLSLTSEGVSNTDRTSLGFTQ